MIVVGSYTSANTRRLTELSTAINASTRQVQSAADLRPEWFDGISTVGISAGASTPDILIQEVIAAIRGFRPDAEIEELS